MSSHSPSCPFCNIAASYPPLPPTTSSPQNEPGQTADEPPQTQAFLILSTKYVLAFLDIMPLTRGHVLVVTRDHYEKLGDMDVRASREIGQWLPIMSRVVMRTLYGDDMDSDWHWNVVQNNGIRAAQQVPHVHFHIIPRPPLDAAPSKGKSSWVMFGRGQRDDLDEDEAEDLAQQLRAELGRESASATDETDLRR
ncbi:Histidine triad nucleotide-binding protein 2, mitochondrial [Aspergillus nanangensis]|uniref:Histidine triad nucleotide-binding protein 2, mitochondrial n=1 Tax=Aspergillus nanangensis TaxID=2582783 RepID=A0AAD4CKC7_ASPNN|nr:Histidine triad nucleotide-binding protein 2, mitochondrial [Aspergillus nanangensis]